MATAAAARRQQRGGAFRIIVGTHFGDGPAGCECDGCFHDDPKLRGKNHAYRQRQPSDPPEYDGDLIDSPRIDLEARFNQGGSRKFERVQEWDRVHSAPPTFRPEPRPDLVPPLVPVTGDQLEGMTVKELVRFAAEEEIDLAGATKREDILKAIRGNG